MAMAHGAGGRAREGSALVSELERRLQAAAVATVAGRRREMAELAVRLDSLSPLRVLERGYAVVSNSRDSRVVVDAATVQIGDELQIRLLKGRLRVSTIARDI